MFSTTRPDRAQGFSLPRSVDHSDALARRFGGWFVTGSAGSAHLGNDVAALDGRASRELASVEGLFDADGYRALSSDVAAHLVFTHQTGMANLLTRASWQARAAESTAAPALHGNARRRSARRRDDERRRQRGRRLSPVHRRNDVDEPGARRVRLRRAILEPGPARPQGPLAARARSEPTPHEIPVQLSDLLARVRRAAAGREEPDLPPAVGSPVWRGAGQPVSDRPVARRPPGHCRDPAGHEDGPAAIFSRRRSGSRSRWIPNPLPSCTWRTARARR